MLKTSKYEVERASFQRPSLKMFILFQKFNEGGTVTFQASDFRGHIIEEVIVDGRASFNKWMLDLIGQSLTQGVLR